MDSLPKSASEQKFPSVGWSVIAARAGDGARVEETAGWSVIAAGLSAGWSVMLADLVA